MSIQGSPEVIERLNRSLSNELVAINQYILHSRLMHHWGLLKLSGKLRTDAISEMHHADHYIERILFLGGMPSMDSAQRVRSGTDVTSCLTNDLALELEGRRCLLEAIAICESHQDFGTRDLFVSVLKDEEEHIDWLDTQLDLIGLIGVENYQQSQM